MAQLLDNPYVLWLDRWLDKTRLHPLYHYAGPWDASIVFVGQQEKGAIIPFTTRHATQFAWDGLTEVSLAVGWTYAQEISPQHLRTKNGIISCGEKAMNWVRFHVSGEAEVLQLPTPQYLLTRHSDAEIASVYEQVRVFVENLYNVKDE